MTDQLNAIDWLCIVWIVVLTLLVALWALSALWATSKHEELTVALHSDKGGDSWKT